MSQFRVVGTTTLTDTGFIRLAEAEVEGNGERFTRLIVQHPGAVVAVPVTGDESVLMIRQYRAATGGELLEVVAGKRDVEGEEPETTAQREMQEEIGWRAGRLVKLCEFFNSPGFCDEYTHLYAALDLEELDAPAAVNPELDGDERRLYELIWIRTVASQMSDARGRKMTIRLGATSTQGERANHLGGLLAGLGTLDDKLGNALGQGIVAMFQSKQHECPLVGDTHARHIFRPES